MDDRVLKALEKLAKVAPVGRVNKFANRMLAREVGRMNALPMAQVVAKIPGTSIAAKAKLIGVSRQTIHYWLNGETRPGETHAKKLERITGFSAAAIRGLADDT